MNNVSDPAAVTLADIEAARAVIDPLVEFTPVQVSRSIAGPGGPTVVLKCENLQRTGAYKVRGAFNRLSHLSAEERDRGVVAASAGNHAQAVALAAREHGIPATIFMPMGAALPKLQATAGYGAEVVLHGAVFDETLAGALEFAERTGAVFIPPFDHPQIIAGQGTVALELLEQAPEVDTIVVGIGGGGLISGIAVAAKAIAEAQGREIRVIGVQAVNAAPFHASRQAGAYTEVPVRPTIADGIAVGKPGQITYDLIERYVDEIVTVTDDEIARAILLLLERAKLVVEPAGAVGVAALLEGRFTPSATTAIVLSGGNIDPMMMENVISHGMASAERYLKLRIPLPDLPGQLAKVSAIVSECNANVLEVLHTRHNTGLQIREVELELHIETRGPEHAELVIDTLRAQGFRPRVVS